MPSYKLFSAKCVCISLCSDICNKSFINFVNLYIKSALFIDISALKEVLVVKPRALKRNITPIFNNDSANKIVKQIINNFDYNHGIDKGLCTGTFLGYPFRGKQFTDVIKGGKLCQLQSKIYKKIIGIVNNISKHSADIGKVIFLKMIECFGNIDFGSIKDLYDKLQQILQIKYCLMLRRYLL